MAKQILNLNDFRGGLNTSDDPRDIDINEFSQINGIRVDKAGKILKQGSLATNLFNSSVVPFFSTDVQTKGAGLFAFSHDYNGAGASDLEILKNGNGTYLTFWSGGSTGTTYLQRTSTFVKWNSANIDQTGGDTLSQSASNRYSRGVNNAKYRLTYTVANYTEGAGSVAYTFKLTGFSLATLDTVANGTFTKEFTTGSNATGQAFGIQFTNTGSATISFKLSNIKLELISAQNISDDYLAFYKGSTQDGGNRIFFYSYKNNTLSNFDSSTASIVKLGVGVDETAHPQYHIADGNIRISDRLKNEVNILYWYGYVNRKRWNNAVTVNRWVYTEARIIAPTSSNVSTTSPGGPYNPNEGVISIANQGFFGTVADTGTWNSLGISSSTTSNCNQGQIIDNTKTFSQSLIDEDYYVRITSGTHNNKIAKIVRRVDSNTLMCGRDVGSNSFFTLANATNYIIYKPYSFYISFIYDNNQESLLYKISDDIANVANASFFSGDIVVKHKWDSNLLSRITGANFYYSEGITNSNEVELDYYFLFELDFNKGIKIVGNSDYTKSWSTVSSEYQINCEITNPLKLVTYEDKNGFKNDSSLLFDMHNSGTDGVGYIDGVYANRKFYIGNITLKNENGVYINYNDLMLKSLPNKFDTFLLNDKIEVSVQDGDEITCLESYADRLLQYKKNKLHIINISQDVEFLEDTHLHKGVINAEAVVKTDYGVAWANQHGCFLYDGNNIINLLEIKGKKVIDANQRDLTNGTGWFSDVDTPFLGYEPHLRQIFVALNPSQSSNSPMYIYDIPSKSWSFISHGLGNDESNSGPVSNFVNDKNGDVNIMTMGNGGSESQFMIWNPDGGGSYVNSKIFSSKDIDFGFPSVRKKVYKLRLSYKGSANNVTVKYSINGDTDTLHQFELVDTNGKSTGTASNNPLVTQSDLTVWHEAELKPAVSSQTNNIFSFQIHVGGTLQSNFSINDMSIIYRLKSIK
tara:strand:+ start:10984 stop:13908 length:2925 start_codon:yes stop_codon:yes gene_type:complete